MAQGTLKSSSPAILPEDAFSVLPRGQSSNQGLTRPSLSYWQDAWIRLKANGRALFSLYLIIGLVLFTFLGPFIWDVDPAQQDVDQISQAPGADRTVTLVEAYKPWTGMPISAGQGLRFVEPPSTQYVRLQWDKIPTAHEYRIYRTPFSIGTERALGLPLKETTDTHFEDLLDLRPINYYYSVVALDAHGQEMQNFETIQGTVTRVITTDEARERNLISAFENHPMGTNFKLPLHPLGTDYLGRDMLARLMHGARVSLFIGIVAPLLFV
ncbi:MAG: hypothetical protein GXP16_09680, partial [Gammaproteobacteria bacterium]|nr:hypothetical protein [Gammaproteobacteria bacterium]